MFQQAAILSLLALCQSTSALPAVSALSLRQYIGTTPPPKDGPKYYCQVMDHYEPVDGEQWQTGNSAPSGASLSINTGYSAGTIITVGADLGLGLDKLLKGLTGGVSFSYAETVAKTVTIGNSIDCPQKNDKTDADYSCSLIVTPGYVKMSGRVVEWPNNQVCDLGFAGGGGEGNWEMTVPRTDSGGNPFYYADACLCDGPGMDQENAPSLKCREECTGVTSG